MPRPLILLVEDNLGDVGLWREAFAEAGIAREAIQVAADGLAALEALGEQAKTGSLPGLIISDARLPGMDGTALGKQLRATTVIAQIPFVIVSGLAPPSAQQQGDRWYQKPHDFNDLCLLVRKLRLTFLASSHEPPASPPGCPAP